MEFEWDTKKAETNEWKHGVSFQEAATVGDTLAITFADPDHSMDEPRYITFGLSRRKQLLVVSHTELAQKSIGLTRRSTERAKKQHSV